MMIALVITLMIVFAMVEAFRWVGETTTDGRASIEMLGQIRHARFRLEDDLSRCTASLAPWGANAGLSQGYVELVEGSGSDNRNDPDPPTPPATSNPPLPVRFIDRSETTSRSSSKSPNTLAIGYDECVFNDPNNALAGEHASLFGDVDDVLMFTARNDDVPYRGRYVTRQPGPDGMNCTADDVLTTVIVESNLAEIIWWAELNDVNSSGGWDPGETFTIRRRVLLIRPDLNVNGQLSCVTNLDTYLADNDISVRPHYDESRNFIGIAANSLGDLSYRHNRTAHQPANYNAQRPASGLSQEGTMWPLKVARLPAFAPGTDLTGEEVVLTNVLAFDLRVWDPAVPVTNYSEDGGTFGNEGLVPGDFGYTSAAAGNIVGYGGYIDLGVSATAGQFIGMMQTKAWLPSSDGNFVYDPWTLDYERDGFDQDAPAGNTDGADQGTNGIDNNGANGPDDLSERETSPPYPFPLKSIQVRIRMYEPDTRQVRQASQVVKFRTE
jgi:hypothetical protein